MQWRLKPKAPAGFFKKFPEFPPLIVQLFYSRGLKTQEQVDEFFNPDYQADLHDPFLMKGIRKATKRICQALKKKEPMAIYGDYDADGVCSTAILFLTLKALGAKDIKIYIPDREKERHGLNQAAIKHLAQAKTRLLITVDCGTRDLVEVKLANSLGMDVVITDHHEVGDKLPKAVAIINPWQKDEKYPFKKLAGAGVVYKLICALIKECHSLIFEEWHSLNSHDSLEKWLLDLVAIATVADVMPIIGENRTLVKYGLGVLAQTKWLGLEELMKEARLSPLVTQPSLNGKAPLTNLDTYTLGYILGPRLNAAGRMNHANVTFQLLISQDRKEAKKLAQQLNQENLSRQNLTDKVVQEIKNRLAEKFRLAPLDKKYLTGQTGQGKNPKLIFEGSSDWPVGIIGLAAGKITDQYHRPTIIYQQKGEMIFASCRSIPQFDLIKAIEKCAHFLEDFGGHKEAAGFSLKEENLAKTKKILEQEAEAKLKDKDLVPYLNIDTELTLEDISWQNYDKLQAFAPFGRANPEPRFLAKDLEVAGLRMVGNNSQHLKLELRLTDKELKLAKNFKAIGFNLGRREEKLKVGDLIDMVFEFIVDEWNGRRDLQMKIVDLKVVP